MRSMVEENADQNVSDHMQRHHQHKIAFLLEVGWACSDVTTIPHPLCLSKLVLLLASELRHA